MKLYFASGNEHKKKEMSRLLGGYTLILPKDEGIEFDPAETGNDFISNAVIKAEALYRIVHAPVLADDSGLSVDALGGRPGIHSARYGDEEAGRKLTTEEKYQLLLKNMEGIEDRKAHFVAALCLILSDERRYIIQETCEGSIALAPSGTNGFGYDPMFVPNGYKETFAQLSSEIKNSVSHRANALKMFIKACLG